MSQHPQMTAYLAEARWFAGKGREYDVVDVQRVGMLPGPFLRSVIVSGQFQEAVVVP